MAHFTDIGDCSICGTHLEPVFFTEEERNSQNIPTGRVRRAVSHLTCSHCMKNYCVDDSFDGPWERKR